MSETSSSTKKAVATVDSIYEKSLMHSESCDENRYESETTEKTHELRPNFEKKTFKQEMEKYEQYEGPAPPATKTVVSVPLGQPLEIELKMPPELDTCSSLASLSEEASSLLKRSSIKMAKSEQRMVSESSSASVKKLVSDSKREFSQSSFESSSLQESQMSKQLSQSVSSQKKVEVSRSAFSSSTSSFESSFSEN